MHGAQHIIDGDGGEARGMIGQTVGDNQFPIVKQGAASIDHVRHVPFPFIVIGLE
jgi:hypothetical protein